jgi:hypothetical protein
MIKNDKNWYSVELSKNYADILKDYLRKMGVYFEPSEAGNLIHFECHMTERECNDVNDFLYNIVNKHVV